MEKMSKFSTRKIRKYLSNVHKLRGTHLQCMNNHYAKLECKGMKTMLVTDYTNMTPHMHFRWKKMSKTVSEYDQEIQQSQTADNPVAVQHL